MVFGAALLVQGLVFVPVTPAMAVPLATAVPSPNHDTTMWVTANPAATSNGVYALEYATDGTLYLGGDFTYVGPPTGGHGIISNDGTGDGMADGTMEGAYPYVDGNVNATVAVGDGSGDFIIGGTFTSVGGVARSNIARINADGTLDTAWTTGANNTVRTLAMDGSYVYAGGSFTSIGGRDYPRLAKMAATDGSVVVGWAPSPDNTVLAIAVTGDTVYVGGTFTTIGGASRNNLAALVKTGLTGGTATSWNPSPNDSVHALATNGTSLYVGGHFTTIDSTSQGKVAKFSFSTGAVVASWNPVVDGLVRTIAINPSTNGGANLVLLGGDFTSVDGDTNYHAVAALFETTGELYSNLGANPVGNVFSITVAPDYVYVGGAFTRINGQESQERITRYSNDGNFLYDAVWNPVPLGGYVASIAVSGTNVSVGGEIYSVGAHRRNGIAALDSTGKLKSWYPTGGANGSVLAIEATGNGKLYVAGAFTTIGGSTRNYLAELNPSTAAVMSFNPNASNVVFDVVSDGTTVWVGGDFATVGGQTRARLAALDSAGVATAWYAGTGANDTVSTLHLVNDTLYVGGEFTGIFNVARNHLARIQTASPTVDAGWDPNITGTTVDDMVATSTHLYVGGSFTHVGASARDNLAAVSTSSGAAASSTWIPDPNGRVLSLTRSTAVNVIFVGGEFTQVGGQFRPYATALRPSGDATMLTSWVPRTNGPIRTLAASGTGVVIGEGWNELRSGTADPMDWHAPARFAFDDVAPSGTISINGGAASTTDPNVTVTISITDDSPVVTQNFSFNNSSWLMPLNAPLSATRDLTLPAGDGTKTVYAKFTDESGNTRTVSDTIYLGTPPTPPTPLPVYRFYRPSTGTHFYTADGTEMQRVRDTMSATYNFEGEGYSINTSNPANTVPLYRLYNARTGTHLYTADGDEKNTILATLPGTYSLDGVAYNVSMTTGTQVYRFYSAAKGVHFYSSDPDEIAYVRANLGHIWSLEGPAYLVGQ